MMFFVRLCVLTDNFSQIKINNMITKKDIQEMFKQSDVRWDKRFNEADARWDKRFANLRRELKDDIEEVVAQFADTMVKMFGMVATKEELNEVKEGVREVKEEILEVKVDVRDIKRQINDLKADLPTPQEYTDHEKRITKLEVAAFPA